MALSTNFLKGSYPPLITPFNNGKVDYDAYAKLVEHHIEQGSHGLLINGTTAEPSTLTLEERTNLVKLAAEVSGGRLPIVAQTGSQSHAEAIQLTEEASAIKHVDALLIVTPYYIRPPQRGLIEFYADLGQRTDLPMMLYHIPGRTAVSVTLDTLKAIKERVPHFVGIKHAVNDLSFVTAMLQGLGHDFRIFVGLEDLSFPMLAVGAAGLMNAVGNILPGRVARLYEEVAAGNLESARAIHFELDELNRAVFFDTNPIAVKYMMKRLGLMPRNEHRLPMMPALPELETRLDKVLENACLL